MTELVPGNHDETKSKKEKNRKNGKKNNAPADIVYDTGHGGSKATSTWSLSE